MQYLLLTFVLIALFLSIRKDEQIGGNTIWGHSIPITCDNTVRYGKRYGQDIPTLSSMNKRFGLECCPSQYSTDRGCVCL